MKKPLKTAADVPALVEALMPASPDVMAVGHDSYCVIDLDRPEADLERILEEFGPRDDLDSEIIRTLRANGRFVNPKMRPAAPERETS